jgi:hypothetical protein
MLIAHMRWSPEALAAGTGHPSLMAARSSFEAEVGGAAGGAERKTRKSRK